MSHEATSQRSKESMFQLAVDSLDDSLIVARDSGVVPKVASLLRNLALCKDGFVVARHAFVDAISLQCCS